MSIPHNNNQKHRIQNITTMCKLFGPYKAFKLWYYYKSMRLKKRKLNLSNKIIEVNGYKLALVPNDEGISTELALFNVHEPLTTKILKTNLKTGMVCLDIGSNIGYYTLLESKIVGDQGNVIAIEPSPINFRYLQKNLQLQNTKNVEAYNFAAGNSDGKIRFFISNKSNRSRTIAPSEVVSTSKNENIIEVPVKRLDIFLEEKGLNKLDFLRMDVEGFELNVYEGIRKTVRKFKPIIQIEVHKKFLGYENTKKILENFKEDGYEIKYYTKRDMDLPNVGNIRDVKKLQLNKLLEIFNKDSSPGVFSLFLENKSEFYEKELHS